MIGESPMRPGIFHASPLVVVTPDISPLEFSARQLIVPVVGCTAMSHAHASVASSAFGNSARRLAMGFDFGGASSPGPQLLCPFASRKDCFHTSHASRAFSVSICSSG